MKDDDENGGEEGYDEEKYLALCVICWCGREDYIPAGECELCGFRHHDTCGCPNASERRELIRIKNRR
jgi:hypothetical protein